MPLAGFNASGQQHHIIQGTLLRTGKPPHKGRGRRYRETNPPVFMHRGTEALERIEALEYASDYEDDGYVLSSVDAIEEEPRKGLAVRNILVPKSILCDQRHCTSCLSRHPICWLLMSNISLLKLTLASLCPKKKAQAS